MPAQWEHPVVREVRMMVGDDMAAWWLAEYPGRLTIGRAAWVLGATSVMVALIRGNLP